MQLTFNLPSLATPFPFSQATQPFIDKVTQQKIMFIDKGPKEEEQMIAR